eukprot:scaffold7638_cov131-Isochrysis_galbana.AAC.9
MSCEREWCTGARRSRELAGCPAGFTALDPYLVLKLPRVLRDVDHPNGGRWYSPKLPCHPALSSPPRATHAPRHSTWTGTPAPQNGTCTRSPVAVATTLSCFSNLLLLASCSAVMNGWANLARSYLQNRSGRGGEGVPGARWWALAARVRAATLGEGYKKNRIVRWARSRREQGPAASAWRQVSGGEHWRETVARL